MRLTGWIWLVGVVVVSPIVGRAVFHPPSGQPELFGTAARTQQEAPNCGAFYTIAHMANRPYTVDYAIGQGANAVEVDLTFARGGDHERFRHGTPCSCSVSNAGMCAVARCEDASNVDEMLTHLAKAQLGVALVVIDAKAGPVRSNALAYAGNKLAGEVIRELYARGYDGNLILSVAKLEYLPMITSAFENIRDNAPQLLSRVGFSVDGEGENAAGVIDALSAFTANIAYGTGRTGAGRGYRDAIRSARARGIQFTYVWTLNDAEVIENYIHEGVSAIMTDHPFRSTDIANKRQVRLAKRGEPLVCKP